MARICLITQPRSGLNLPRFEEDAREHRQLARVREDFGSGARSGVNGAPTFFINGMRYDGLHDLQSMLAAIKLPGQPPNVFADT